MIQIVFALVSGLLFGAGLVISHMVDPAKVLAFLDLAGDWDPSLALVMGAAVAVFFVGYRAAMRMDQPVFAPHFEIPDRRDFDRRLIGGSILFGVGWGLIGLCPGPALADLTLAPQSVLLFVAAMIAGIGLFHLLPKPAPRIAQAAASGAVDA
ncbi:YeeE/YedE family protein [Jiella sp. MQZ9-1]|uniref:YeeE/YedE family protein n=1 Tax=Jiella flava TaxID=2816857 RepID=A0A939G171_9HYPH|nr:DUF6691 family protein [Jiella flava]MBO0663272.1 YeeE/YedE family protein [Jiella flava]MCD2471848.1 YeeE/YedE family protein [Jiella flava]